MQQNIKIGDIFYKIKDGKINPFTDAFNKDLIFGLKITSINNTFVHLIRVDGQHVSRDPMDGDVWITTITYAQNYLELASPKILRLRNRLDLIFDDVE